MKFLQFVIIEIWARFNVKIVFFIKRVGFLQ